MTNSAKTARKPMSFQLNLLLALLTASFLVVGTYLSFYYAPVLHLNGLKWWSQKIFYYHVPVAWGAMSGLFLVLVGSLAYLKTRNTYWDTFAVAGAETCFIYAFLVLVTGPLWARPSWNTFWKWEDPRLMSFLALFLILGAYQLQRAFGAPGHARRVASAALGIVGAASTPFVYYSVKLGRSLHPMLKAKETDPRIVIAMLTCLAAFFFLFILLFRLRRQIEEQQSRVAELQLKIPDLD